MRRPDAIEVLCELVDEVANRDSPAQLRAAVAALGAVDDSRARRRLMELADNFEHKDLARAALSELSQAGGDVVANWINSPGSRRPAERISFSVHAGQEGAVIDLSRIGFVRQFQLGLKHGTHSRVRIPFEATVFRGFLGAAVGALPLLLIALFMARNTYLPPLAFSDASAAYTNLKVFSLIVALAPALPAALVFSYVSWRLPFAIGGWGGITAQAVKSAIVSSLFLAASVLLYASAAGPVGEGDQALFTRLFVLALAGIILVRVLTDLLADSALSGFLRWLVSIVMSIAVSAAVHLGAAPLAIQAQAYPVLIGFAAVAATAALIFGASGGTENTRASYLSARSMFAPRHRAAALVSMVAVLSVLGVSVQRYLAMRDLPALSDTSLSSVSVGIDSKTLRIPLGRILLISSMFNQTLTVRAEGDRDIMAGLRIEGQDGRIWSDNDDGGRYFESRQFTLSVNDSAQVQFLPYDRRRLHGELQDAELVDHLYASSEAPRSFPDVAWDPLLIHLFARFSYCALEKVQWVDCALAENTIAWVELEISGNASRDEIESASRFEELFRENLALAGEPPEGFVVLLPDLKALAGAAEPRQNDTALHGGRSPNDAVARAEVSSGPDALRDRSASDSWASAGSVLLLSDNDGLNVTATVVAGRAARPFAREIPIDRLRTLPAEANPELVMQGLAWSRLHANVKQSENISGGRAIEDLLAGRTAMARLRVMTDPTRLGAGVLAIMVDTPVTGRFRIDSVDGREAVVQPDRVWSDAEDRPVPSCFTTSIASLLLPPANMPEMLNDALAELESQRTREPLSIDAVTLAVGDGEDCPAMSSWRLVYSEDDNEDGLYEIDLESLTLEQLGRSGVTGHTVGLAYDPQEDVLYGSGWQPLLRIRPDGTQSTEFGNRGAEGLAFDPVDRILYASHLDNFFLLDPDTGDVIETLDSPWTNGKCLAMDTLRRRVYALSDDELWSFDIASREWLRIQAYPYIWSRCGLAYDISHDRLVAFGREDALNDLWSINPETGAATSLGSIDRRLQGGLTFVER